MENTYPVIFEMRKEVLKNLCSPLHWNMLKNDVGMNKIICIQPQRTQTIIGFQQGDIMPGATCTVTQMPSLIEL